MNSRRQPKNWEDLSPSKVEDFMESEHIVHIPVMVTEVLEWLSPPPLQKPDEPILFIDCTLGEGGHSERFLSLFPFLNLVGIDRDPVIQQKARNRLKSFGNRVTYFQGWYDDFFSSYPLEIRPDRILFDLGISVFHYEESSRGFSFSRDEPLDMRLDPGTGLSARDILNQWSEERIANLIFTYGEERYSRRIARAIVERRKTRPFESSKELAELIFTSVPHEYRHGRIHPATRTFQGLRIEVNQELERIQRAVKSAFQVLKPGGILGVISFHSLEDRIIKNLFRDWAKSCICPPEVPMCKCGGYPLGVVKSKKPIVPGEDEVRKNSPSRSAKFRVIEKLRDERFST